jgi:sporulation protein YunB
MKYAKIESKKIAIDIISNGVSDEIIKTMNNKDLFTVEKDNDGNIEIVDYNSKVVNEVLSVSSKKVMNNFNKVENKNNGIVTRIPIGVITNNVFFENLGPKIPVKLNLEGNALTSLKTDVKEYGLNSALIQISVKIEANVQIIVPLYSKEMKVINEVPISIKITKGNVSTILNND